MSELRRAPKRRVVGKSRVGSYPNVRWQHQLECGHVESRKRAAPATRIGCKVCLNRQVEQVEVVADTKRYEAEMSSSIRNAVWVALGDMGVSEVQVSAEVRDVDGQAQLGKAFIEVSF